MHRRRIQRTHLFLVRFWTQEASGTPDGESEWEGKVQRATDGEAHEFHDWGTLVDTLRTMLATTSSSASSGAADSSQPGLSNDPDSQGGQR